MTALRFGLFSDLHLDIVSDGERRLTHFLSQCLKEDVDFVLSAGDFTYPEVTAHCLCRPEKLPVNLKNAMLQVPPVPKMELLRRYNSFPKPHYHVLGNHEMDFSSKDEAVELLGMPGRYYRFSHKGWQFFVLDANLYRDEEGVLHSYRYGDYHNFTDYPYLDREQLRWLEDSLRAHPEPAVLFSHQPLYPRPGGGGVRNYGELRSILTSIRDGDLPRVRMCVYGHVHRDEYAFQDGVLHYCVNSISNHWAGTDYTCRRFPPAVEEDFPNLRYTFPYRDPLHAIVTLDEDGAVIRGRRSAFIPPTPEELGYRGGPVTAQVADRRFRWRPASPGTGKKE